MRILDLLGWERDQNSEASRRSSADTETVRKIAAALDRLDPDRARYIAAFAYVLSRVARADLVISEEETREMERIVREKGGLPEEQAVMIVQMAKTQNALFGGVENFLVTREFEKIATREQKIALLHCLFAVSAADRSISSAEDTTIREIANELRLDHGDFIAVKTQYREYLATLAKPDASGSGG
ncbi:MAG: TerB family tellurite resistance protein [Acidobacteriia bacterium]|nr:TerB family tellurite resistance protein [Terriglobia bacterium]